MAISQRQIHEAADELVCRGESPTLAAVRKELSQRYGGGGGSFTTISEALKIWRARQHRAEQVGEVRLPDAVRQAIETAGRSIYQAAREAAQGEVEALKSALDVREQEIAQERSEALVLADQLSAELDQTRGEVERLRDELTRTHARTAEATTLAQERQTRIAELGKDLRAEEAASKSAREEADTLRSENAKLQERTTNMEQRAGELSSQVEHLQTKLTELAQSRST